MGGRTEGGFVLLGVKSGARDFPTAQKWRESRDYADALFFAVDADFPLDLLPGDAGLIVTADRAADILRESPAHPIASARRRALLQRFSVLAASRLGAHEERAGTAAPRAALREK